MTEVPKVGSLCSGYDGIAVALDVTPTWQSENDRHVCTILEQRFPGVPNLGDLTAIDWQTVEPVDLLTAGFPCQPVSQAGNRKVTTDDRWIWPHIATAVRVLRPRNVFLENVSGLLRPWRNKEDGCWYRAPIEEVVADLAALGYVGSWVSVRAADAGSCHARDRVFILAVDTDEGRRGRGGSGDTREARGGSDGVGRPERTSQEAASDTEHGRRRLISDDGTRQPDTQRCDRGDEGIGRSADLDWWRETVDRAEYAPAVERWDRLTRPVPPVAVRDGRLNPRFSEWMMGVPDGWITDCDIPVTAQHKAIGNGVVPQQVRLAWQMLTGSEPHVPKSPKKRRAPKRIPSQSKKRRAQQPTRAKVRALVLANAGHRCEYEALIPEIPCGAVGLRTQLEVDEIRGGSYRNLEWLDPDRCHATCPAHHDFKTAHKNEVIRRLEAAS